MDSLLSHRVPRCLVSLKPSDVQDTGIAHWGTSCLQRSNGFEIDSGRLTVATWIDNNFAVGNAAHEAISMLQDLEVAFRDRWHQRFGVSYKKYIVWPWENCYKTIYLMK